MARRDESSGDDNRMDQDDLVRGRADEMEDASQDEDFDDSDDLDDEDVEDEEGSF